MKVLCIEGIPGSGKTTLSKHMESYLRSQGEHVIRYNEGDLNPIDLAWCSITDEKIFQKLCEKYENVKEQIMSNTICYDKQYVTAYTKIKIDDDCKHLYEDFEPYEIYRVKTLFEFKNAHIKLWKEFAKRFDEDITYIFECVFFQNHINELILKFNVSFDEMLEYFKDLLVSMTPIKPKIIYINVSDVESRIKRVADERKTDHPNLYKDWINLVMEYMEKTTFAKPLHYLGYDGFIRYLKDRNMIELQLLEKLACDYKIINLERSDEFAFEKFMSNQLF